MTTAQPVTVIDDERVRVTRWTFRADGDYTGHHTHENDYVVVPITGGTFTVTESDGATHDLIQHAGVPYSGTAGTAHNVTNSSGIPATFVEIEIKK